MRSMYKRFNAWRPTNRKSYMVKSLVSSTGYISLMLMYVVALIWIAQEFQRLTGSGEIATIGVMLCIAIISLVLWDLALRWNDFN